VVVRVLTWNLFHGRVLPPRDEDLLDAFAEALAGWDWDVALLQEVPPWWSPALAAACGASGRHALTSRNALLPLRRTLAQRRPELMRANGGGANAILLRAGPIAAHARRRLRLRPERRVVHAVRDGAGRWFANVHASTSPPQARRDVALARATAERWSAGAALVLGGDLNLRDPSLPGFVHCGGHRVDHVFARGWEPAGAAELLDRSGLSDHAPLRVALQSKRGSPASGVEASA
jgi:endonuclease/exonuclease/phosphatase family metal-dependent hydrolase